MKLLIFSLIGAIPFLLANCNDIDAKGDVAFAKETFKSLARGDSDVVGKIDWETFSAMGVPVGQQYLAIETGEEKDKFTKGFITQFAANFRESGGSVDELTNWRVTSHDETHTEVAADSGNGVLRLTVSERDGIERLTSFEIEK